MMKQILKLNNNLILIKGGLLKLVVMGSNPGRSVPSHLADRVWIVVPLKQRCHWRRNVYK